MARRCVLQEFLNQARWDVWGHVPHYSIFLAPHPSAALIASRETSSKLLDGARSWRALSNRGLVALDLCGAEQLGDGLGLHGAGLYWV